MQALLVTVLLLLSVLLAGKVAAPWLRAHVTPLITAEVQRELSVTDALQRLRRPWLTRAVDASAATVCIPLFVATLPPLSWAGYPQEARAMIVFMAFVAYLGAYLKDLLCAPRPLKCGASPARLRLIRKHAKLSPSDISYAGEYGAPSSHTSLSFAFYLGLPLLLHSRAQLLPGVTHVAALAAALLWASWIAVGRAYSCMHSPLDVAAGALVAAAALALGGAILPDLLTWLAATAPLRSAAISLSVVTALMACYPKPLEATPTIDDIVAFLGAAWGTAFGAACSQLYDTKQPPLDIRDIRQLATYAAQVGVGLALSVGAKEAAGTLARAVFGIVLPAAPLPLRKLWQPPIHGHKQVADTAGSSVANANGHDIKLQTGPVTRRRAAAGSQGTPSAAEAKGGKEVSSGLTATCHRGVEQDERGVDLDVLHFSRLVSYAALAFVASSGCFPVFRMLGVMRH